MIDVVREGANGVADALLSLAALIVSWTALQGWRKERRVASHTGLDADIAEEDAKTYYALAAVQRPSVFGAVLIGSLLKIVVLLWMALEFLIA